MNERYILVEKYHKPGMPLFMVIDVLKKVIVYETFDKAAAKRAWNIKDTE